MKYIFHHLGLGDHIICNGMVRNYKQIYGRVTVFCKPHNFKNVEYMYRDDDNIIVLPIGEVWDVDSYILTNNIEKDTIRITADYSCSTFDESFYKQAGFPFEFRYSKFKFLRDLDKENEVYQNLNPNNEEYVFTHGGVDLKKVRKDLKIIDNPTNYGVFDILKLIENATEVHIMESSIKCLVNSYVFSKPKFYYHQYIRGYDEYLNSKGKNNFITIF
jgi:hypothetical protein